MRAENRLTIPTRRHWWRSLGTVVVVATSLCVAQPAMAAKRSSGTSTCQASPSPVASGATVTVTGSTGGHASYVSAYLYYSDGSLYPVYSGSISGGAFSLSAPTESSQSSLWGPFSPAPAGPARADVYVRGANKPWAMVASCSFDVS
jgi:hypothetical protein